MEGQKLRKHGSKVVFKNIKISLKIISKLLTICDEIKVGNFRHIYVRQWYFKGTVSPDYKCLEVTSIKIPLLGHVTPDIKKILNSSFYF
jgi:hypothetical protein